MSYTYEGIVNGPPGDPSDGPFGAFLGESIRVEYTFESSTVDSDASTDVGLYENAITDLTVTVGGNNYVTDFSGDYFAHLFVWDKYEGNPTSTYDGYIVAFSPLIGLNVGGLPVDFLRLLLVDDTATTFNSDALPSDQPMTSDFTTSSLELYFGGQETGSRFLNARDNLQAISAIPLPPSLWLLGIPLLGLYLQDRSTKCRCLHH